MCRPRAFNWARVYTRNGAGALPGSSAALPGNRVAAISAAYKRTLAETETPRQIERRVMSRLTGEMERFQTQFDAAADPAARLALLSEGLREAIWENQRLWQNFVLDLSEPENALPGGLRASLISIGLWVERHSQLALRGVAGVGDLVEVNRNIIRGLSGEVARPLAAEEA